jgi:hypothetical protein
MINARYFCGEKMKKDSTKKGFEKKELKKSLLE